MNPTGELPGAQIDLLASLSAAAMHASATQDLFDEATRCIPQLFGVDFCKVLQLWPNGEQLLLRSGSGWVEGLVGVESVGADWDSQAGYTLLHPEHPIIVDELVRETRFHGPALLHAHHVVSGMSAAIPGPLKPWGVIGVHSRRPYTFSRTDARFLQAAASILALGIARLGSPEIPAALLGGATSQSPSSA